MGQHEIIDGIDALAVIDAKDLLDLSIIAFVIYDTEFYMNGTLPSRICGLNLFYTRATAATQKTYNLHPAICTIHTCIHIVSIICSCRLPVLRVGVYR
jgi:hypothetical protein